MADRRRALITGANKGIGLEAARQLGQRGIAVILGCRDVQRGSAAAALLAREGIDATAVALDVTDAGSVHQAATAISGAGEPLDILINNAGILDWTADNGPDRTTLATFHSVFATNFFGAVAVTQALLPALRRAAAGRIVMVSSILGSIAEHADPHSGIYQHHATAYDTSKAALNLYTVELAITLRATGIKVNAAHPGWVKTDLGGPEAPLDIPTGARTLVDLALLPDRGPTGGFFHLGTHLRW
jgi:NAD(P)-dependent dehydrogenase (short-subunit alcohol dehydrogenase family)